MPEPPVPPPKEAVEPDPIDSRTLLRLAGLVLLGLVGVAALCAGLLRFWQLPLGAGAHPPRDFQPAAPRLQPAPQPERAAYFAEKNALLHSYGPVDQAAGTVRIPIEVAMDLLAAQGAAPRAGKPPGGPP